MSLLDDLAEADARGGKRPRPCTCCLAIMSLKGKEREALRIALEPGNMALTALINISGKHGLGFNRGGILRHREEGHDPTS